MFNDQSVADALDSHDYAALQQVHGNRIIIARASLHRTEAADGLITDQANLVLQVRIADCQPMIFYEPDRNVVGMLHVGWKGLVANAIEAFMQAMQESWNVEPKKVLVGIGPCLCASCSDFTNPLLELPSIPPDLIVGRTANLRAWADRKLIEVGITPDHIERIEDCTRCHPEKYWTYRGGDREEMKNGRTNVMACVLGS